MLAWGRGDYPDLGQVVRLFWKWCRGKVSWLAAMSRGQVQPCAANHETFPRHHCYLRMCRANSANFPGSVISISRRSTRTTPASCSRENPRDTLSDASRR